MEVSNMYAQFGVTKDAGEVVNKTFEVIINAQSFVLNHESSVMKPTIRIQYPNNLYEMNYVYIADFHRYYFVTDIVSVREGLWEVSLRCDVLMTYKDKLLALDAIVERQANRYNLYIDDNETILQNNTNTQTLTFGSGFSNSGSYLLTVAGG